MKSFFRFLSKNKLYTAINFFGLTVSLACILLISDYAFRQLLTDSYQENRDRLWLLGHSEGLGSFYLDGPSLQDLIPEIDAYCRVSSIEMPVSLPESEPSYTINCIATDSTFFHVFTYKLLSGDARTALDSRDKCVITRSTATQCFGEKNPIGETILINGETNSYTVSAVIEDFDRTILPNDAGILLRIEERDKLEGTILAENIIMGGPGSIKTFFLERENADLLSKEAEIKSYLTSNSLPFKYAILKDPRLVPFKEVIFTQQNSLTGGDGLVMGNRKLVFILISISLAILLFALINYINLTVAQTGMRAKEMATRRLLGAYKHEITLRFIRESLLMTAMASALALGFAILMEPKASALFGGNIDLVKDMTPDTLIIFLGLILVLGTLSGLIPAWSMSRFRPISVVKGAFGFHSKMISGRLFIIFQNTITIVLIAASITIYCQIDYMMKAPLGFRTTNIMELKYSATSVSNQKAYDSSKIFVLKNEIEQLSFVEQVGLSTATITGSSLRWVRQSDEEGKSYTYNFIICDHAYAFGVFNLELIKDNQPGTDAYYPDMTYMEMFSIPKDTLAFDGFYNSSESVLLGGIMQPIHVGAIIRENPANLFQIHEFTTEDKDTNCPSVITIKLRDKADKKQAVQSIAELFESVTGEKADGIFVEDIIAKYFVKERKLSYIVLIFTVIAIIISALGLLAMSTYFTRGRMREIGVRKVFGSSNSEVLSLLLWKFIRPMIISFIFAVPVSWIIMNNWLANYSYRMNMKIWIFLVAGIFSFCVAVGVVLWQTLRAARSNPVISIKNE